MGPRKGLSFDEKRDRLLELFTETAEFFTLKELEKVASKRKGIVSQSVKEVLQSLADDDLVNSDKCGNQTVFWCLPSEASQKKKAKLENLGAEVVRKRDEVVALEAKVAEMQQGREDTEEHAGLLTAVREKGEKVEALDKELSRFVEFDPGHLEGIRSSMVPVRDSANRWTDNVFCCQSWITEKFGIEKSTFFQQFEIPDDIDYLE